MSELLTQAETEEAINLNYKRLQDSRAAGDSDPLQKLFEQRMNEAIDMWSDFHKFTGAVALVTDTEAIYSE